MTLRDSLARMVRRLEGKPGLRAQGARGRAGARRRRQRYTLVGIAATATLATIAVGTSGAYFTGASLSTAQTGNTTSLPAATDFLASRGGSTTTTSWTSPTFTDFAASGASAAPTYTVLRSSSNDFSAASTPVTVGTTTGNSIVDTVGEASLGQAEATDVSAASNGDGSALGLGTAAVIGGKGYYWGKFGSALSSVGVPKLITGIPDQVAKIAAGLDHVCALTTTSRIFCIGDNGNGELGNNTTVASTTDAVEVTNYTAFNSEAIVQIGAGENYSCALTVKGTIGCWGVNTWGQLGLEGSVAQKLEPVRVGKTDGSSATVFTDYKPKQLSVGPWGACVVKGAKVNVDGSETQPPSPVACWGRSNWRQHGSAYDSNSSTPHSVPVNIPDPNGVLVGASKVSVGHGVTCVLNGAVAPTVNVACWAGGGLGLLGDGAGTTGDNPVTLPMRSGANQGGYTGLSVGSDTACAFKASSYVCWGRNLSGQLGRGNSNTQRADDNTGNRAFFYADTVTALPAGFDSDVIVGAASGSAHTCVITLKKGLGCWGENSNGELGIGSTSTSDQNSPVPVVLGSVSLLPVTPPASTIVPRIVAGGQDGRASFFLVGDELFYSGGSLTQSGSPALVASTFAKSWATFLPGVTQMQAGQDHVCGLIPTGSNAGIYCIGANASGQLGNNTLVNSSTLVKVVDPNNVFTGKQLSKIAVGEETACALASDGTVGCWGDNSMWQLGSTTLARSAVPVKVDQGSTLTGAANKFIDITVGYGQVCAARAGGGVACWGDNTYGKVGVGTTSTAKYSVPQAVVDPGAKFSDAPILSLSSSFYSTCLVSGATAARGKVYCWGRNNFGQLGDGGTTNSATPQAVDTTSTFTSVAVGTRAGCGWRYDGAECWGTNDGGWLGNGSTSTSALKPQKVAVSSGLVTQGISSISFGWQHACGLSAQGGVYCWGDATNGATAQNSATANTSAPTLVQKSGGTALASGNGGRYCLDGASLIDTLTCTLAPARKYWYQVSYSVAGSTSWSSGKVAVQRG